MADMKKVIKGLECCSKEECAMGNCPYFGEIYCVNVVRYDALELLKKKADAVNIVRCYECECWEPENVEEGDTSGRCRMEGEPCEGQLTDMMWFCADGVKKDD